MTNPIEHSEGPVARAIEEQTAKLPSDAFLGAAGASIATSFLQSDPEAERSVINDQLGRAGQAQAFELSKQFTPGLAAFVISKRQRQAIRHPGFF